MRVILSIISILFLIGCGNKPQESKSYTCVWTSVETGTKVSCSDGGSFIILSPQNGADGRDGKNGTDGVDGLSVAYGYSEATSTECTNGGYTVITALDWDRDGRISSPDIQVRSFTVCNGLNGRDGVDGIDGRDGTNGQNGTDGRDGKSSIVDILNPCGDSRTVSDEVLLRLSNGQILASLSDSASGKNTRFAILEPGTYKTTDGDACYFSIDAEGNLTNESYRH